MESKDCKKKDIEIKEVTLASYDGPRVAKSDNPFEREYWTLSFSFLKTATCVVDRENNKVVDIETKEVWDILKRKERNNAIDEGNNELEEGKIFALNMKEKDWENISYLYQLVIKNRAKEVYKSYLETNESSKKYTKKIGK